MATTNKRIKVAELDFDTIKTNLKNFLRGQEEFTDYDFEGSALSTLLDVLAYNTHYNNLYTNLSVNEMFLDSASKRANVVSLAKMLGYTPASARCAHASVNLTVSNPTVQSEVATLSTGQPFTTTVDGKEFTFYNKDSKTVSKNSAGKFVFEDIEIIEGKPLEFKYTVESNQRYIIPNNNVDLDTLTVRVQETQGSDLYRVFTRVDNLVDITSISRVYFIKEIDGGLYEISFGDGIIGRQLSNGNIITLNYHVSSLDEPNNARAFSYGGNSVLGSNLAVTTTSVAAGGSSSEEIESIKFNAPRLYAAQNRAVTPDDYKAIILNKFPEAGSVAVWGGENNNPPVYGKTYISIKPKSANKLTNLQKDFVKNNILQQRNIVSITPEIVDPEYFNIKVTTFVYYNERETTKTASEIETLVKQAIFDYDDTELQKFDGILRYSKLVGVIDDADQSIVNNITRIMVRKQFAPSYNISAEYVLNLINPISQDGGKQGDVFGTTGFYLPGDSRVYYLDDDAKGNVRLYYIGSNFERVVTNPTIGTIDYEAGVVTVRNLTIASLEGPIFEMQVKPESYDVVSALNQLVQVSRDLTTVKAIADKTINGDLEAGYNYKFESIRS